MVYKVYPQSYSRDPPSIVVTRPSSLLPRSSKPTDSNVNAWSAVSHWDICVRFSIARHPRRRPATPSGPLLPLVPLIAIGSLISSVENTSPPHDHTHCINVGFTHMV